MIRSSNRSVALALAGGALCLAVGVYSAARPGGSRSGTYEQRLIKAIQRSDVAEGPRLNLARHYLAAGRANDALDAVREAARRFPESDASRDVLAQALVATGRHQEAVSVLGTLVGEGAIFQLRKASAQLRGGDFAGAEATLAKAARIPSLTSNERLMLGQLELDLGHFAVAAVALSVPSTEGPSPDNEALLGYALLAAGSYGAAIPVFERLAVASPQLAALQFYLGSAIRLSGDRQRLPAAEEALAKAASSEPHDALIHYELGLARVQLRRWELAREALETAARLNPQLPEAQRDLARVRERTGDKLGAAVAESRHLRLVGDPAAAVRLLEPLAKRDNLDIALELCEAYYDNLQTPLTLRNLEQLSERFPTDSRVQQARFRGERAADRNQEALESLTRAEALLPKGDLSLDADRKGLLQQTGRYDELERMMRQAIERNPGDATAHYDLGAALARWPTGVKRDQEAEEVLRKTIDLDPSHARAQYDLAMVIERNGRAAEAIPHLRAALDRSPVMKDALRVLGRAYAATGDKDRSRDAFALYRAVEARESEQKRLELPSSLNKATGADRLALAQFYNRTGNRNSAIVELEILLRKHPDNQAAHRLLTGLYGQTRRFQRQFEERRALDAGSR